MANNRISASGTLKASIEMGITLPAAISELVDNSLDAHATVIIIHIPGSSDDVQTILEYYDNGHGMNREELNRAVTINERTPATNETQGCKGIGMNNALSILTQLKSPVSIVSKRSESSIVDIDLDYPDYIEHDNYNPTAGRNPSRVSEDLWNKRIRDELSSDHGTVMSIPADENMVVCLLESIISREIYTNIFYDFGIKYYKYMLKNPSLRIGFQVGNCRVRYVQPIDPLAMNILEAKYRRTDDCKLYVHKISKKPQTRTYFTIDGKMGYTKNVKSNKEHTIEELPSETSLEWKHVGDFPIESAYSKDWLKDNGDIIRFIENGQTNGQSVQQQSTAKTLTQKKDREIQKKIDYGNGLYIDRGLKNITRVQQQQKRDGDFDIQKIHNNSRHRLTYPQIELDEHMDTQLNKSALQYDNVDISIRNAVSVIRADFIKKQIAILRPAPTVVPKPATPVAPKPTTQVLPPSTIAHGMPPSQNTIATTNVSPSAPSHNTTTTVPDASPSGPANIFIKPSTIAIPTQVRQHPRTLVSKKQAIEMIEKLNTVAYIGVSGKYAELLINVLCLTNGKGGDAQLARQFMGLSKGNIALLSEQVIDTYNSKYSDNESVSGGTDIAAFYREHFPENVIKTEAVANL
jgi:hypothetical protein